MIQSTAATLRLAVSPGAAAPGAPVAVGGGGVFTLPGVGTGNDVAAGATTPDFAAMMVAVAADDRQPDAATGKGLPMPVVSPAPPAADGAGPFSSLPPTLTSLLPQPAPADTHDDRVTCGLMIGKPFGLKPITPGDVPPILIPTPKVPLPVKAPPSGAPPSGASPLPMPVGPVSPQVAGSSVDAPVTVTPPTAMLTPPEAAPLPAAPLTRSEPGATSPIEPAVRQGGTAPAVPLERGEPAMSPIAPPPPSVSADVPQSLDIIHVDADAPAPMPVVDAPVATAPVATPHKSPRSKAELPPVAPKPGELDEPAPDDRAAVTIDTAPPTSPAAVLPVQLDTQSSATPAAATVPLVRPSDEPAGVAAQRDVEMTRGATTLRPAAPSARNATPVGMPVSPGPVTVDPAAVKPVAPGQIFAPDIPVAQPPTAAAMLPPSDPIVEHAPVEAPGMSVVPPTPRLPVNAVATNDRSMMPDDIAIPAAMPIVALAAAVPIAGAPAQPNAPATTTSAAPSTPRDEVVTLAAALSATITAPERHSAPTYSDAPALVAAAPPAAIATPSAAATLATVGVASPMAATQTPPAPASTSVGEGPVDVRNTGRFVAEDRIDASRAAPAPYLSAAPVGTTASAGIVFGAAKLAAQRSEREDRLLTLGSEALAATTAPAERLAVAASQAGNQPSLDMTDQRWPHAMVAHIEALRDAVADAANAADTRIRLVPDALGGIDIGVRQDGDTLHVHFTADQPQTRALLQEAQPRLAEAAEARGLKLGQTSVGTDAGQGQQRQQQPHQSAAQPARRNSFTATTSADETGDGRIA